MDSIVHILLMAAAKLYRQEGAKVVISGRDRTTLDRAVLAIGGDVLSLPADVADLNQIDLRNAQLSQRSDNRDTDPTLFKIL
jgi:NADP-dependent 3-hydroxy acid dehydrogenase YdfG